MASVILREQFPTRPPPLEFYSSSSREIIFSSGMDSENIGGDHRIRITQTTEEERASCTDTPATRGHVRAPSAELCRAFHVFRPIMRLRVRGNLETTTRSSNEFVRVLRTVIDVKKEGMLFTLLRIKSCNDDLYLITRRSLVSTADGLSSWRKREETMTSTRERKGEVRSLNAYYAILPAAP